MVQRPLPQADHVLRAVRAALTICDATREIHAKLAPERHLSFSIGVHVGPAVLGLVGTERRLEYTAIGDTVNIAKRLEEHAAPGQILISADAFSRIAPHLDARRAKPLTIAGRDQPVPVYHVLSTIRGTPGTSGIQRRACTSSRAPPVGAPTTAVERPRVVDRSDPLDDPRGTLGRLEQALSVIAESIVCTDGTGRIQWCNRAFDLLVGQRHTTTVGAALVDLLPLARARRPVTREEHPAILALRAQIVPASATSWRTHTGAWSSSSPPSTRRRCKARAASCS